MLDDLSFDSPLFVQVILLSFSVFAGFDADTASRPRTLIARRASTVSGSRMHLSKIHAY